MSEAEQLETGEELSVEERASAVGWREGGELDAEAFLERREGNLGLMRANNKKLEQELAELRREQKEMASFLKKAQADARKQGYSEALKEIEQKKRAAIKEGDDEAFFQAEKEEKSLQKEMNESDESSRREAGLKMITRFQEENEDLFDDYDKAERFKFEVQKATRKGLQGMEILETAAKNVREHFKSKVPTVEGGSSPKGGGNKGFKSLPKSAKDACAKFGYTSKEQQEEYARIYWENNDE